MCECVRLKIDFFVISFRILRVNTKIPVQVALLYCGNNANVDNHDFHVSMTENHMLSKSFDIHLSEFI